MAQEQKQNKPHYVTIKGTKAGLILRLDDKCSFDQLLSELETKLLHNTEADETSVTPKIAVTVHVGKRYLSEDQKEWIRNIVYQKKNLLVDVIESDVVTKKEAESLKKENEITSVSRTVRSGQVLNVQGDLLLVGDVNPGGCVVASGNIFVMGVLKGVAHAGHQGRKDAVITASLMKPTLVRIANHYLPYDEEYSTSSHTGECAFIDDENNTIKLDRLHILHQIRPGLNRL